MIITSKNVLETLVSLYVSEHLDGNDQGAREVVEILGLHTPREDMAHRRLIRMADAYRSGHMVEYEQRKSRMVGGLLKRSQYQLAHQL